jgi:hypothetical protein
MLFQTFQEHNKYQEFVLHDVKPGQKKPKMSSGIIEHRFSSSIVLNLMKGVLK